MTNRIDMLDKISACVKEVPDGYKQFLQQHDNGENAEDILAVEIIRKDGKIFRFEVDEHNLLYVKDILLIFRQNIHDKLYGIIDNIRGILKHDV